MADQFELWNTVVGDAWVEHADHFDRALAPFGEAVFDRLGITAEDRVVDIGCGVGATTLRLGERAASVLGVDVSDTMLEGARARARGVDNVRFLAHDVDAASFATAEFDVAFSRFGIMFFEDPVVAFGHIRSALVDGGRLGFVAFSSPFDNPFMLAPVMAAAAHVPMVLPSDATAPGPFSLADPARIEFVLAAAGFGEISVVAGPDRMVVGPADDLPALALRSLEQNPGIAPGLAAAEPDVRAAAITAAADVFAGHVVAGQVVMAAGTWIATATAR
jgi:SAM-dependent methyltransferase